MEGDIFDTLKNEFNIEEEKAEAVSESPKYIQKVEEKLKNQKYNIDDIERTFHEIIHCKQKQILFNEEYFKGNEAIWQVMIEGSTTFNQKFVKEIYESKIKGKSIAKIIIPMQHEPTILNMVSVLSCLFVEVSCLIGVLSKVNS